MRTDWVVFSESSPIQRRGVSSVEEPGSWRFSTRDIYNYAHHTLLIFVHVTLVNQHCAHDQL